MSLLEEIGAEEGKPLNCKTCAWLSQQSPDVVRDFESYINSGKPRSVLRRVCSRRGLDISEGSLRRHVEHHHGK